ncbi:efflux transporter outer membrane subunit [Paraburkholderia madseniana]|uniref:efflux transporter outer membrane subunit n=1 Tax=Paraburkholderia madseniana TaxID=2599607 RepID=UPI0015C5285C|nr:efflux transporter outer membrane subunit [Paraburkholderia madseniana]NPT64258.1 efflux transporter outer membrane subunit [Paraburkholderia madseniana]
MVKLPVFLAIGGMFALAGCSFAPTYSVPTTITAKTYKEVGSWMQAKPADQIPRSGWWKVYHDPVLNSLEPKVVAANPNLQAALARHDEASALLQQVRSGLFPTVGLETDVERERQSENKPLRGPNQPNAYNSATLNVGLNYDLDLWGRVRNQIKAGKAAEDASSADVESLRLSLEADLAGAYFNLLSLDQQSKILAETIGTYQHALQLTESRRQGGIASDLDVSRAQTQLDSARATESDIRARRALYEHAIATLIGVPASSFSMPPSYAISYLPNIPTDVPSALLQRRPDIAAAERRVAQANAQIGVAKAAFFPDISLGLDGGFQSDTISPWMAAPNEMWSIGPMLMMTLFDGGRRSAIVHRDQAKLAENGAKYKATVLTAFQQVEDNLSQLNHLGDESAREDAALAAAKRTLALSMSRYRDGTVSYLDVVTAQTTELSTQLVDTQLQTRQLEASVGLIQALGGGWSVGQKQTAGTAATSKGGV